MNTLIIYASKYGCAQKCAARLEDDLSGKSDRVNLSDGGGMVDITPYDSVIIGGSIYMGRIQKSVSVFCQENLNGLLNKKIGLFICCMFTGEKAQTQLQDAFPKQLYEHALAKACFGGEITISKLNFMDKMVTKVVSKDAKPGEGVPAIDPKLGLSMVFTEEIDKFILTMKQS